MIKGGSLEALLGSVPPENWTVQEGIILDWHDGPVEGFCRLSNPPCVFRFELFAERFQSEDVDDRVFRLSQVQDDAIHQLLEALSEGEVPQRPMWVPRIGPDELERRRSLEKKLDELARSTKPSPIIVRTKDFHRFENYWLLVHY
jgi:hypothetical protein